MPTSTRVFISATSRDLGSVRQLVKEALLSMDCHPVEQTNFPPDYRTVHDLLQEKIASCQAVLHIVGLRYGAEPDPEKLPEGTTRRSYTQMEYDLARQLKKQVYVFLCPPDFPYDACAAEPDDKQQLQQAHREAIASGGRLRTKVATPGELATKVRELQIELRQLRGHSRRTARNTLIGLVVLVLVLVGIGCLVSRIGGEVGDVATDVTGVKESVDQVSQSVQTVPEKTAEVAERYKDPQALAERMREGIRKKAAAELQAARQRGAKWDEIRELERRRDLTFEQVDQVLKTIQEGLAGQPDPIFREASRILAEEGVDAALGYLDSHQQDILARVDQLADREAQARKEKHRALEPLLLKAQLHESNLAWDEALKLYETVAEKAPQWSHAQRKLGHLLDDLARYAEAEPHLLAALQLAADDQQRRGAANELGLFYLHRAEWKKAEPLLEQFLQLSEELYGPDEPETATPLNNLAHLLYVTNRLAEAERLMRRALAIEEQSYGAEHPKVASSLNNLA